MIFQKDTVQIIVTDCGPCSYVRWRNWAHVMTAAANGEANIVVTNRPLMDEAALSHTASVVVARPTTSEHGAWIRNLARFKNRFRFKVLVDLDDLLFDLQGRNPIPSFNPFDKDPFEIGKLLETSFQYVDAVIVSTAFLKACVISRFPAMANRVVVFGNFIPTSMFCDMHGTHDDDGILDIVYGGAANHFSESDPGDIAGPWIGALDKVLDSGNARLHIFGESTGPFKGKNLLLHNHVDASQWPSTVSGFAPDIYIGPLVDHPFNRCKSDIKYLEACAIGSVFIGSDFNDSPYRKALVKVGKDTDELVLASLIECFRDEGYRKDVVDRQKDYIAYNARTMEDRASQDAFMKLLFHDYLSIVG